MAIDLKVETPDTTLDVATALIVGADSQSNARPSIYPAVRLSNALATEEKTLANKTLTSPVVNTLVHASGGVLTVPNSTGTIARLEDISSGSYTSPMVSRGQMLRRGAASDEAFAKGTVGYTLVSGSNDPDWYDMGFVSVKLYGATGDGTTDDTAAIQACIDANKGKTIFFPDGDYLVGTTVPIRLLGSTYDRTKLVGDVGSQIIMDARPTTTTYNYTSGTFGSTATAIDTNFGSGWTAMIVRDTYGVILDGLVFNGQRTLQPASEFAHTLLLCGVEKTKVQNCRFYELRGDGIYLTQADLNNSSINSRHIEFYNNEFWNDEADGRNSLSICGCDDGIINGFKSYNVGGTILAITATVTCTVTVASPGVFTKAAHGFVEGTGVSFDTTGTMPTGLSNSNSGKIYYVSATGLTANEFQVSLTRGGASVNVTGAGTGTLSVNTGILVIEPGGIDFEPNHDYQSCKRWALNNLNIQHSGTGGLSIQGKAGGTETVIDVSVSNVVLINNCPPYDKDSVTSTYTQSTSAGNLRVVWADNISVRGAVCRFASAYGIGPFISDSTGVTLEAQCYKVYTGAIIGAASYDDIGVGARGLVNCRINLQLYDVSRFGMICGHLTDVTVKGTIESPSAAYYTGVFGVLVSNQGFTMTQTDVSYEVSVRPSANWTRSYRSDPGQTPTLTRVKRQNCDLGANDSTGWAAAVNQIGDVDMANRNVTGVTNRASIPTAGYYRAGDFVRNDGAAIGTPSAGKILMGWQKVTSDALHVAGTNWHLCVVANS